MEQWEQDQKEQHKEKEKEKAKPETEDLTVQGGDDFSTISKKLVKARDKYYEVSKKVTELEVNLEKLKNERAESYQAFDVLSTELKRLVGVDMNKTSY